MKICKKGKEAAEMLFDDLSVGAVFRRRQGQGIYMKVYGTQCYVNLANGDTYGVHAPGGIPDFPVIPVKGCFMEEE